MKAIIDKFEQFTEDHWAEYIGPSDKSIPTAKEPSSVANLINWACNENGSPAIIIGGELHVWNGKYYARDTKAFNNILKPALRRLGLFVSQASNVDFIKHVEKSMAHLSRITRTDRDDNPRGLNFQDGVLMMTRKSVEFIEGHDPSRVFTYILPFNYKGERKASKTWRPFIEQIVPDKELRRYTLASFANAIAGDPMQAQRMLLLMGVGASGKSTLIDAVAETLGDKNTVRIDDLKNLTKDDSRYRIDLANHVLCVCGDASSNIGNKDVLKQIVSKEEISGRRLFKEVEYFTPRASLIVASNEIGFTHALGDSGIARRIDIIQFNNPVAEKDRDPHIGRKLAQPEEQREMVMDMIDCMMEMQNTYGKMVRPDALADIITDLMYDGDSFLAFMGWAGIEAPRPESTPETLEWQHQSAILDAYNRFAGQYNASTIGVRTLKTKLRAQNFPYIGRRGKTHDFQFEVVDNELFTKNYSFQNPDL